jgi:hypothetical protein
MIQRTEIKTQARNKPLPTFIIIKPSYLLRVRHTLRIRLLIQIIEFSIAQLVWWSVRLGMGAAPGLCPIGLRTFISTGPVGVIHLRKCRRQFVGTVPLLERQPRKDEHSGGGN